jgi:hypothetical protein
MTRNSLGRPSCRQITELADAAFSATKFAGMLSELNLR